jgi:hypothetical protein
MEHQKLLIRLRRISVTLHRGAPALDLSSSHPFVAVEGVAGQRLGGAAATTVLLHRQLVHSGDVFSSQIK